MSGKRRESRRERVAHLGFAQKVERDVRGEERVHARGRRERARHRGPLVLREEWLVRLTAAAAEAKAALSRARVSSGSGRGGLRRPARSRGRRRSYAFNSHSSQRVNRGGPVFSLSQRFGKRGV